MLDVFIGYDEGEDPAYQVCRRSLLEHTRLPCNVTPLRQDWLRRIGLYRRQSFVDDGQVCDTVDRLPYSTQFAFTRFVVPSLRPDGWVLFCDSDFLWRADVAELFEWRDPDFAVMCVKHQQVKSLDDSAPRVYVTTSERDLKMRGQAQSWYERKNWSSLMLWNCSHPSTRMLTPFQVNTQPGRWLHQLRWLRDDEIGELPEEWNWLDGHSSPDLEAKAVHFTRGTPDMPGWEDTKFASEWLAQWGAM